MSDLIEYSFYLTYAFLMTTGTITFIEALRTKNESVRHILNLETCISVVAAFFYSNFIGKLEHINYEEINLNRYVDWAITTPHYVVGIGACVPRQSNQQSNGQIQRFYDYFRNELRYVGYRIFGRHWSHS